MKLRMEIDLTGVHCYFSTAAFMMCLLSIIISNTMVHVVAMLS